MKLGIIFGLLLCVASLAASTACVPCCPGTSGIPIADCASACGACPSNKGCHDDGGSHSYFKPRQITPNNMLLDNLAMYWWYHDVLCESDNTWYMLHVSPFYQRSTHGKEIANYFLPCKQSCVSVKEDGSGDIGSLWLNLIAGDDELFDACLCLRPERSVAGAYINMRFDLSRYICHGWLDIAFAVMKAKHNLNMCVQNNGGLGTACDVSTLCDALQQPDWCYGKFCPNSLSTNGVDDVQIRFGYDWFYCDTNHISPYMVGIVPTGNRSCADYVFEPTVGSKHGSIGLGVIGDVHLMYCGDAELTFLTDFKYRYVLGAHEKRSFDLCNNGDWSRYLLVVKEDERDNPLPGINVFTQDVRVTPRSTVDWWLALHYQKCQLNVEVGYDFWWRAQELVQLCCFAQGLGIYDMVGSCAINAVSASNAEICQSVPSANQPSSDVSFVPLTCDDLNLNSGATPKTLSNTLYAAVGYDAEFGCSPAFIGAGASYEFGRDCTALSNWTVWFTCAFSY